MTKRLYLALILLVLAAWPAHAQQPAQVIGPITPGDCPQFSSTTIIKDAGFNCNGGPGGTLQPGQVLGNNGTAAAPATPISSVDANALGNSGAAVTANYSIATTDCGSTILAGTGSTGQFTLTLPAVTGFPAKCSVLIKNGDTTNGKILSGFPSDLATILYPRQSVGVKIVNGAWATFANPGAYNPNGGVTLFASTTGSASNDCLTATTACTLAAACNSYSKIYMSVAAVTINVADGTYNTPDGRGALCSLVGDSGGTSAALALLTGNCVTPTNVVFSIPAGDYGLFVKDYGNVSVSCVTFTGANGAVEIGIYSAQYAIVDLSSTVWNSFGSGSLLLDVLQAGSINLDGTAAMTLNAAPAGSGVVLFVAEGGRVAAGGTIAIPSALAWGGSFLNASGAVNVNLSGLTFTGSGVAGTTGTRATLTGPGYLQTGGTACNTFFPGNVACTLTQGFQDDAADPLTTPCPVASGCTGAATLTGILVGHGTSPVTGTQVTGAVKDNGSGTLSQAACADLSNGAASCSTDTTNASNISSGTLANARLANAGVTPIGNANCTLGSSCNPSSRQTISCATNATLVANTTNFLNCQNNFQTGQLSLLTAPFSGTLRNLYLNAGNAPVGVQTYTVTIFTGTYGSASAGALTCSMTGSAVQCSDLTHTVSVSAGQVIGFQVVSSATAASLVGASVAVELDNP